MERKRIQSQECVADKWRSVLGQPGLKYNYLGITYISHYIKNGDHYKSGLDHIYFNPEKIVKNCKKLKNCLSDHRPIICGVQLKKKGKKNECYTLRRSWKNYSLDAFLIDLVNQE